MAKSTIYEGSKRRNNNIVPSDNGAEEKLRESEKLFRTLTEKSWAGIYVVQKGIFKFINTNAAAYAAYNRRVDSCREYMKRPCSPSRGT